MSLPTGVIAEICPAPLLLRQIHMTVFAGPGHVSVFPVTALPAAPSARLVSSRESHRTEHDSASVADLAREDAVLGKEFVTLLDGEHHCTDSLCSVTGP